VTVRPAPDNATVPASGTTTLGFIGNGTAPAPPAVTCTTP
jgi:hypothetical protein